MIALALLVGVLSGCSEGADRQPPSSFGNVGDPPGATYYDARGVTCWTIERWQGVALSCLPDSALTARVEP